MSCQARMATVGKRRISVHLMEFCHPDAGLRILEPDGEPPGGYRDPATRPGTWLIPMKVLHGKPL